MKIGLTHLFRKYLPKNIIVASSNRLLIILVIMMLSIFTVTARAANHYVYSGATGSSDGSDWANAYTDLPSSFIRGDTYYVGAGSYAAHTFSQTTSGTALITILKATVADHGTTTGWLDSYGTGQAVFNGKLEFTSSYWVVDGVTGGGPSNKWNQNLGFKITETNDSNALIRVNYSGSANNITIRHVEFQGKGSVSTQGGGYSNDGIAIYNSASNITLSYAWFHGIGRCPVFITGAQNIIFEYIYVSSYFGSGAVHSEVMSTGQGNMGDVTWRYSLVTDIESTGGLMWDNHTNANAHLYVYGNIFYKPTGATWSQENGVIGGWTGGNGETFRNCFVYNNTFINVDYVPLSILPKTYSGNIAENNLFYNSAAPDFSRFATHDYNHFINSGGTQSEPHGSSAASGSPFVDYLNLNFGLTAATIAGITLVPPFNLDPNTVTRGADGVMDRGAFEFVSGTIINTPSAPILNNVQ